jgi:small subunit ribosomal protein S17
MGDKQKMEDKSKLTKKETPKVAAKKTVAVTKKETPKVAAKKTVAVTKKETPKVAAKKTVAVTGTAPVKEKIERTVTGKVLSNKMDKTITVLVERKVKHPLYGKYINQSNKFHAHDEKNEINEGDIVQITEHKPISKSKSWVVTRLVSKGQG